MTKAARMGGENERKGDNMGVLLFLVGCAGLIVFLAWLVLCAVRKNPAKRAGIGLLASAVLLFAGVALFPSDPAAAPPPELSEASLSELVANLDGVKPENVSVSLGGGVCEVSYTDAATHWNEGRMVGAEMSAYINFCRGAFALDSDADSLSEVVWLASVEMTDSRGNASIENTVKIDMERETFALYDWDNLDGARIYEQFSSDCLTFWVRPSIAGQMDQADIYYSAK